MIDYLKTVLTRQYEVSLDGCVRVPGRALGGQDCNGTFQHAACRTLYLADLYLSRGKAPLEQREFHRRGGSRRIGADPDGGLAQAETLAYLAVCRRKAVKTLVLRFALTRTVGAIESQFRIDRGVAQPG